jgi:hypothetical protein
MVKSIKIDYILIFIIFIICILFYVSTRFTDGYQKPNKVKFVFVCHSQETVNKILNEQPDYTDILFVGSNHVDPNPRVVICRNLYNNIEYEKKLLTFTAWYAIVNNNLYSDYDFICIFEYDVVIEYDALYMIKHECTTDTDVISFSAVNGAFDYDVNTDIIYDIFNKKYDIDIRWYPTTNHCMRRDLLVDFVEFYSDKYEYIKRNDYKHLSWYHERVFSAYLSMRKKRVKIMPGVQHIMNNSHKESGINS